MAPDTDLPPPDPALAEEGLRHVRGLAFALANLAAALLVLLALPGWLIGAPLRTELWRGGVATLPLAALLIALAGLAGTMAVASARVTSARVTGARLTGARLTGARLTGASVTGASVTGASATGASDPARGRAAGRAARMPQALLVPALALPAAWLAWRLPGMAVAPAGPPAIGFTIGGAAILAAFPLLVAQRGLAALAAPVLPEGPALAHLLRLATLTSFTAGVLEVLANLGVPYVTRAPALLGLFLALCGVEVSARAIGRLFLPPPASHAAQGAAASTLARLLAGAGPQSGFGAPLRQHLGIDFSRSWALIYLRQAALPMLGCLVLLAWGMSGVVLVGLDQRAVQERFGAPVAVLPPGLHLGLPWPLGAARFTEFGPVHALGLSNAAVPRDTATAEDAAPASADRLWEQAHPAELALLIASSANQRESFQTVSADIRVLYRVGMTDADALHAAYAAADPPALVRAAAGRVVSAWFTSRTLDQVLGADREAMAAAMRDRLQAELDADHAGLQAVAVVIEAIHPPAGAADAYHNVRAAEIAAHASVAVERGAAATIKAQSRQYAFDQTANAQAALAETVGGARTRALNFSADQLAARAGGKSFLLERYLAALSGALARAPKTIIDHRLNLPEAPVLDLRPLGAAAATTPTGKEE